MIRTRDVVLTGLMIAAAVWTFQVKRDTAVSAKNLADLRQEIAREKDKIALLNADWAVLTQPVQMQKMVERFSLQLQLQQLEPSQIITLDELPPIKIPDDPIGQLAREYSEPGSLFTGSIGERKQ